jgi:hypothetical protein
VAFRLEPFDGEGTTPDVGKGGRRACRTSRSANDWRPCAVRPSHSSGLKVLGFAWLNGTSFSGFPGDDSNMRA